MKRTRQSKMFGVNWAEAELHAMRAEAQRRGLNLSELIRHWVRKGISAELAKAN